MNLGKGMAALVACLMASALHAQTWEHYFGLKFLAVGGIAVADLNLDGKPEAIIRDCGPSFEYGNCNSNVLALLNSDSTGRLDVRSVAILPVVDMGNPIIWTRPGFVDRVAVAVNLGTPQAEVLILGGVPLQVLKVIPAPMVYKLIAIDDVDADGEAEIVAITGSVGWMSTYLTIFDYRTGDVEWTSQTEVRDVVVGQFDADPALELVVTATSGQVIDGATHAVEWSYAGGFGDRLLVGRFGATDKLGFAAANSSRLQIFQSQPYSPVSEISFPYGASQTAAVVRVVPGGADQIAVANAESVSSVVIYDPRSSTIVRRIGDVDSRMDTAAIGAGDLDGDGRIELVITANETFTTSAKRLSAVDLGTSASDYARTGVRGPFSPLARGDLEGSGNRGQIALLDQGTDPYRSGQTVSVLDVSTGAMLRSRTIADHAPWMQVIPLVATGQLDADVQQEIVIASQEAYSGFVMALDGRTLAQQWRVGSQTDTSALGSGMPTGLGLIDVNGDGREDVVVGTADGRIVVLNGANGAVLWTSITLSGVRSGSLGVYRAASGAPHAIVARGEALYLFDLASRLLVASTNTPEEVQAIRQWGSGASCRIAAMDRYAAVSLHRCDTLAQVGQRLLPPNTTFFWPMDSAGNRFLAGSAGYLYDVDANGDATIASKPLGMDLGIGNQAAVDVDASGRADVVIGSNYLVTRVQVAAPDKLFANGFD